MTLQEIIDLTRRRLGDYELPYDWYDQELVDYANYAIYQMSRNVELIEDPYTPAICNITTSANTYDYALSAYIVELRSARITGELGTITQTGVGLSDLNVCGLYIHSDSDTSFKITIDGVATVNTFKWSDDGGVTWDATTVSITGLWQELSHGIFIKFTATGGHTNADSWAFTISDNSASLLDFYTTNELYTSFPSWRTATTGQPTRYILDYRKDYLTLYTPPDKSYLINMDVRRYPATDLTITTMSSQTPEISSRFHMVIIDGILYQAYNKSGDQTYNDKKADRHFQLFKLGISDLGKNKIMNQSGRRKIMPHPGTV